jgi:MerR family copper efflux transcriptional regulator
MNIGQIAEALGVTAKMIRHYESIELIATASRTDAGYRQYTVKDVQTLRFIKRPRDLGFSIGRIKTLLSLWQDRDRQSVDVKEFAETYIAELEEDISKLQLIRDQLRHVANNCHGDNRPDCPILDELARKRRSD